MKIGVTTRRITRQIGRKTNLFLIAVSKHAHWGWEKQRVRTVHRKKAEAYLTEEQARTRTQEFQTLYQENLGLIYRYVYSKVGNREEAEDLTSQIFLKAVRGINTERGALSVQKWLFQVARTTIADYWRGHYRIATNSLEALLESGWEGPTESESAAINLRPIELVQRLLQALPEHYREVLTCRFLLNLTIRETAGKLGLSEANVKVLQFRALKRAADLAELVSEMI
jgi:RNA polymerase sigma-70 factor (ECF subfamily)